MTDIANLHCVICEGKHAATSRDCPTWSQEREILRVKYTRGVSFPEARRIVGSADIATSSYAQVTRGKAPVNSVTVKDASVQVSEDIPAWGSQVPDMAGENPPKVGPSRAQMGLQRSRSLISVPRSQMRQDVTSPTNRPRKKIRIARGESDGPDLNVTFGKGSEDPTNRFNVLLDYDDEMETIALAPRASTRSKSSQNSKR
ncbi:uncharacterized protein LOC110449994 [Mizuhopecten yessoensis]|uniref:uncharacterized protein LOC110449994 n=1 Tax=Mizuhopecten yessoensis TaxID=6573 RepID=UPI000B45D53C|nr:uncharacterized protein LOC110449994 [Mizuhopecten yessoensis]